MEQRENTLKPFGVWAINSRCHNEKIHKNTSGSQLYRDYVSFSDCHAFGKYTVSGKILFIQKTDSLKKAFEMVNSTENYAYLKYDTDFFAIL